jgi:hypothetical protein
LARRAKSVDEVERFGADRELVRVLVRNDVERLNRRDEVADAGGDFTVRAKRGVVAHVREAHRLTADARITSLLGILRVGGVPVVELAADFAAQKRRIAGASTQSVVPNQSDAVVGFGGVAIDGLLHLLECRGDGAAANAVHLVR